MHGLYLKNPPEGYAPVEVRLKSPDDFLKVKETLTRMGIASKTSDTLYQSCHILHKAGKYYIVHFKEMFALDGRPTDITENDLHRRNTIAWLLDHWGLIELVDPFVCEKMAPMSQIKVVSFADKKQWTLEAKYSVGSFKK
jgi:hypothetical protein